VRSSAIWQARKIGEFWRPLCACLPIVVYCACEAGVVIHHPGFRGRVGSVRLKRAHANYFPDSCRFDERSAAILYLHDATARSPLFPANTPAHRGLRKFILMANEREPAKSPYFSHLGLRSHFLPFPFPNEGTVLFLFLQIARPAPVFTCPPARHRRTLARCESGLCRATCTSASQMHLWHLGTAARSQ
jgi:hypothetical protein